MRDIKEQSDLKELFLSRKYYSGNAASEICQISSRLRDSDTDVCLRYI